MSYYLYLVETKKEYTLHLTNIITPLIYEGVSSIYDDARNNSTKNEELKLFQSLLRKIPSWNEYLIEQETKRIIRSSQKGEIVEDLIKAVIKSNIMILTNTPPEKKDNMKIKHDITSQKFIHNIYIEVARNVFQNPFLFYHEYNSYELKENQRKASELINKSIGNAIRKMLPMNMILQNYLGNTFDNQSDDFQNSIPNSDYDKLRHMLNKEPNENSYQLVKKNDTGTNQNQNQNQHQVVQSPIQSPVQMTNQIIQQNDNGDITVNLQTQQNKPHIESSEHFKELQKLVKQNISPIENEVNKIMLKNTEKAMSEALSEKVLSAKFKHSETSKLQSPEPKTQQIDNNQMLDSETSIQTQKTKNRQIPIIDTEMSFLAQKTKNKQIPIIDSEDASVAYFKQYKDNNVMNVYDNSKKKEKEKEKEREREKEREKGKPYINLNINDNSSAELQLLLNDLSSVKNDDKKSVYENKKKYFNNNVIL
jgi:hypothetical protein